MKVRGFTLIELLVVIAVLGISLAAAFPSFRTAIQNNRLTTQANEFTTAINMARSESSRASRPMSVCPNAGSEVCGTDWTQGYFVFYDDNLDGARVGADETVVRVFPAAQFPIAFTGAPNAITFGRNGFLAGGVVLAFSVSLADCKGDQVRNFTVAFSGRATVSKSACS